MIKIKIANTPKLQSEAYRLRYRVYVEQDKKFSHIPFPDNEIRSHFDDQKSTVTLLATENRIPIGTISYYVHSPTGLPIQDTIKDIYDLNLLLNLRSFDEPLFSCGMLAVDENHRRNAGLVIWLYKFLFKIAAQNGARDVIATNNYLIEPMLLKLGFRHLIPMSWYSEEIDNFINLMYAELDQISGSLGTETIPGWHSIFHRSSEIWISKRESFIREGKTGNKIFLLSEGTVDVTTTTNNTTFYLTKLFPGDTFGEMGIFPDALRIATVTPTSLAVAWVIGGDIYEEMLDDPDKTLKLLQILVERVKEMNRLVRPSFQRYYPIKTACYPKSIVTGLPKNFVKAGETIIMEGRIGRKAYFLQEGEVMISIKGNNIIPVAIGILGKGSTFGFMALLSANYRTSTVIAKTDCTLRVFSRTAFSNLLKNRETRKNMLKDLLSILNYMNKGLRKDYQRDRMLGSLKKALIDYFAREHWRPMFDDLPLLSAQWVADEMGISLQLAEDLLSQLIKKGVMKREDRSFVLTDPEALNKFKFKISSESDIIPIGSPSEMTQP